MSLQLLEHEILETLREGADRIVCRTRYRGEACVTRVILRPVPVQLGGLIEGVVTSGIGSLPGMDEEVIATLEGYRVRCRLGEAAGLPAVRAAGLAHDAARCPPQTGLPFVTTRWIPGVTLDAVADAAARADALSGVLRILRQLHAQNIVYGDLKPHNVVVGPGGSTHLIDLDTLREVPNPGVPIQVTHRTPRYAAPEQEGTPPLCYPASDVFTIGLMACELLGGVRRGEPGFPPPLPPPWRAIADACFRQRPLDRPQATVLLDYLAGQRLDLPTWTGAALHAGTEPVHTIPVRARAAIPEEPPPLPAAPTLDTVTRTISVDSISQPPRTRSVPPPPPPVAESLSPERPPDIELDTDEVEEAPTPPTKAGGRRWGTILAAALVILVGAGAGIGAAMWGMMQLQKAESAKDEAARLLAALQDHKTVASKNDQATLQSISEQTQAALTETLRTPELLGLYALETVWLQKWQYTTARWSIERFAEGEAVVAEALAAGQTETALLAQGVLLGGACWKMPASEITRKRERCEASLAALEDVERRLERKDSLRWMLIEARWAAVMSASALSVIQDGRGDARSATTLREAALRRCRSSMPIIDAAPVNGRELIEDCLKVAGALQEFTTYLEWTDWLLQTPPSGSSLRRLQQRIFVGVAPACEALEFNDNGTPRPPEREERGNTLDLCRYLGFVALGCPARAEESRVCTQSRYMPFSSERTCIAYMEVEGVPWDAAEKAARSPLRTTCPW